VAASINRTRSLTVSASCYIEFPSLDFFIRFVALRKKGVSIRALGEEGEGVHEGVVTCPVRDGTTEFNRHPFPSPHNRKIENREQSFSISPSLIMKGANTCRGLTSGSKEKELSQ
jgi:hypothetical protein